VKNLEASHKFVAVINCWLNIMSVKDNKTTSHSIVTGKKSVPEYFFLQYRDDLDRFKFEDGVKVEDLPKCRETYQLETLNSFFRKQRRTLTLHTLYGFCIDIDGVRDEFPLSLLDILERWRALGFSENPSEVRRTSEGRFHVIIKITPVRAFPEKISYWKKCAKGLYLAFKDLGADEGAITNPVGFVRIPGHPNCKYPDKPRVEIISGSNSILTLTDIYQTLNDDGSLGPSFMNQKSIAEKIGILERGVPPGIGNYACFTLAIYYRGQGKSKEEILEKLLTWNEGLAVPDLPTKVVNTVACVFRHGYSLSIYWLNKLASIAVNGFETPSLIESNSPKKTRNKINEHSDKIRSFVESNGGSLNTPQRALAKSLNIPFTSFRHAIKRIPGLLLKPDGKGRNATAQITLRTEVPNLKIISSKHSTNSYELNQTNEPKAVCLTGEKGACRGGQ
jgi:hypothetical protein